MANFDKFLDKGNDILDRAEEKAKERQAISENPEEKQRITVGDMAGAGVDYAKDKAVEKLQDKFLSKDGDAVLKEGAKDATKDVAKEGAKDATKDVVKDAAKETVKDAAKDTVKDAAKGVTNDSASDAIKNKYLNRPSNADSLLEDKKSRDTKGKAENKGEKNSSGESKNHFGDSKNPNEKSPDSFKKDPTAGANAAKDGAKAAAKEGVKDAAKEGAKDAAKDAALDAAVGGDATKIAKSAAAGDMDKATDTAIKMGVEKATEAAVNAFAPGAGGVVGKAAGFATRLVQTTKTYKAGKYCCGLGCLGILGIILGAIMFIPMMVVYITKFIADIIESIPIVGAFSSFIQEKLTEKLGMDFGDFDFEDIGQDTATMEKYAKMQENFMAAREDIAYYKKEDTIVTTYKYESDGAEYSPELRETIHFDPEALISDYLPLYKIFAGLAAVDKGSLADDLYTYFLYTAEFELAIVDDVLVTYEDTTRPESRPDPDNPGETITVYVPDRIVIRKMTPRLILKKVTTLTDVITFEWEEQIDGENVTWVQTGMTSELNTEVIAKFNRYSWSADEISSFEYVADCNPISSIYDAGMYGFTSTFTMPIDDYRIAVPYDETTHPYIEIADDEGTEVKAVANATVKEVGANYIKLKIGTGDSERIITYSNLREQPTVAQGATVTQGQVIGYMGAEFLHFQVEDKNGVKSDPNVFLASTFSSGIDHGAIGEYTMKSYKQADYGVVGGVSMKDAACGPTSMAMVLSSARCGNQDVSPAAVASLARSKNLWSSAGASWSMFKTIAPNYGLNPDYIQQLDISSDAIKFRQTGVASSKINTVLEAIGRRDPVIFLIHGINQSGMDTKFTRGGHFIVVDGYVQDGVARIMDPGSTADARKWANINDAGRNGLFTGAKQVWIFKQGVK